MSIHRTAAALVALAGFAAVAQADVITGWNQAALNAIKGSANPPVAFTAPPPASRALAIMHTAMYDAVNAISKSRQSYAPMPNAPSTASKEAAAAQAAHDVLSSLYPALGSTFDAKLATDLGAVIDPVARAQGVAVGQTVASSFLALRSVDGANLPSTWHQGNTPTSWKPTGPSSVPLFNQYAFVQPWCMTSPNMCRQAGPPAVGSAEYNAALQEVHDYGVATGSLRTQDQTDIANFWAAGGGTVTPPGMWNQIAQSVTLTEGTSLEDNARLFAQLNMANADAAVSAWDMKLAFDYERPITAIGDGGEVGWTPLLVTPQFQSYASGHSTFSAASAAILAAFFGDNVSFSLTGEDTGLTRSFTSFTQAAAEAGQSRIYGGIHFQFDNTGGLAAGEEVGAYIAANFLQIPAPMSGGVAAVVAMACLIRRRK